MLGLRIWFEDTDGLMHAEIHLNINEELPGIDYGEYNFNIDTANEDGLWLVEEPSIELNDTDIVFYWYYLVIDGHGHQITDQYVRILLHLLLRVILCFRAWSPGGLPTTTTPGTTTEPIPDEISVTETSEGTTKHYHMN